MQIVTAERYLIEAAISGAPLEDGTLAEPYRVRHQLTKE